MFVKNKNSWEENVKKSQPFPFLCYDCINDLRIELVVVEQWKHTPGHGCNITDCRVVPLEPWISR